MLNEVLRVVALAPSAGLSEPWRFVVVDSPHRREAGQASFTEANTEALVGDWGERRRLYAGVNLAGPAEAPVHLGSFAMNRPTKVTD